MSKGDAPADLLKAVLLASRRRSYTSPVFAASADRRDFQELSPKQLTVLRLLAQGLERKEIAERMGIGEETVKSHTDRGAAQARRAHVGSGRRDRPDQLALRAFASSSEPARGGAQVLEQRRHVRAHVLGASGAGDHGVQRPRGRLHGPQRVVELRGATTGFRSARW